MSEQNGATAPADWGANDELVDLPSGARARLREKINMWALFRRGVLTPELFNAYQKAEQGQLADLAMAIELNDLLLSEMFVEPKVFVPDGETECPADHVHVDRIADDDVTFVLERAFRGARAAAGFRGYPGGDEPGADSADVREGAVGDGGAGNGNAAGVPAGQKARSKAGRAGAARKPARNRATAKK